MYICNKIPAIAFVFVYGIGVFCLFFNLILFQDTFIFCQCCRQVKIIPADRKVDPLYHSGLVL